MASKYGECQLLCRSVQINFEYKWTIKSFSSLDSTSGIFYESDVIQLEKNGVKWCLRLYPGGKTKHCKGHVSCYLQQKNTTKVVKMCKIRVKLSNIGDKVLSDLGTDLEDMFVTNSIGCEKAIKADYLKRKLIDDTLVLSLEATYCVTSIPDCVNIYQGEEITPLIKVTEDFKKLWISKKNSDFVISVGQEDIPVHSYVLDARSKVFSAMFEHDTVEKRTRRVEVTDFEKNTMESFMEYIYSGSVREMNFDLALDLLRASDKYEVSDLKLYCYNHLKSLLNEENVCQVLLIADIYNAEKLRSHAIEYFCLRFSEGPLFMSRPQLLYDIVQRVMIKRR